jgi:hypothetical protein
MLILRPICSHVIMSRQSRVLIRNDPVARAAKNERATKQKLVEEELSIQAASRREALLKGGDPWQSVR